jgi:hypothetical protein
MVVLSFLSEKNGKCLLPQTFLKYNTDKQRRRTLSQEQQLEYINAVKCLQSEPGQTQNLFSGVQSRYDDYLALHINMTEKIHFNVSLQFLYSNLQVPL